jgi:hypothetical protein
VGAGSGVNLLISYGFGQQFRVANMLPRLCGIQGIILGRIALQRNRVTSISMVVLALKIGNKHPSR